MSNRTRAIFAIVIASLFWATNGVVSKPLLSQFSPMTITFVRMMIASLIILPLLAGKKIPSFREIVTGIVPIGLLNAGNILVFYTGLSYTTVNATVILYAATPLLVALLSSRINHEPLPPGKFAGIAVGFLGVASMFVIPALTGSSVAFGSLKGNIILLGAVTQWALYTVYSRRLSATKQYDSFVITAFSIFTSAVVIGLALLLTHQQLHVADIIARDTLPKFLYIGLFVTVLTFSLFQWAIKRASSTLASLTNYLQPVFAFCFSWIFLGERLTPAFLVGSGLVFLGVFIISADRLQRKFLAR